MFTSWVSISLEPLQHKLKVCLDFERFYNCKTNCVLNNTMEESFAEKVRNHTAQIPWLYDITQEDTNWIITSSFMIFTMQTGEN